MRKIWENWLIFLTLRTECHSCRRAYVEEKSSSWYQDTFCSRDCQDDDWLAMHKLLTEPSE